MLGTIKRAAAETIARLMLAAQPTADRLAAERLRNQLASRGRNVEIRRNVLIQHPDKLRTGDNVLLNHNALINAGGGVTIGSDVVIGPGCMILTSNHFGERFWGKIAHAPVVIGSNVWLAAQVVVTPGVTIGSNVIVAAGAVVTKDIPENSIAAGVPAVCRPLQLPFRPDDRTIM